MSALPGTFLVPMHPPVAPALRPFLQGVIDSIATLGPAAAAACWRTASRQIFIAIADGELATPDARRFMEAAGITEDDLDRLGFWLLDNARLAAKGECPVLPPAPSIMIRLVRTAENGSVVTQSFETDNPIAALKARGFEVAVAGVSKDQRPELATAPLITGFSGPIWERGTIRYEDRRTALSLGL